ncbi:MAG: glycosyltransferase family 39 protein, partial [Ktedonobacterales bacterium]
MSVQSDRASIPESAAVSAVPTQSARRDWLRHWELWAALAGGAFLRLWQPGASGFLGDQAGLMQLASLAVQRGAIPVTGIYSSINTLNPPLSVYVLLPFAWLSHDPLLAVISQECWNVAGILFCYIFVLRTFGRRTAAISTLLFATAGAAVDYSRLLWQQDYLPPFIALFALFTFVGATQGRPRWLAPATVFLTCAILLHPTAALLIPTLLLALLLCQHKPRTWE